MNPGLVIKLRPAGPWRIGPDSGARNRVDLIYHSDSLYSAVVSAMARLGSLDAWLDATARRAESAPPEVCFSSCFPFLDEIGFIVPPRTVWPPVSRAVKSGRVRWKSARFVPLGVVQAVLAGQRLDENHWSVDGPSECLVPAGRPGPFRTGIRWSAAVDRLTGTSERHSTACLEFRPGAGLWTIVSFHDEAAQARWLEPVKAAFRLLADSGFGGERSRGWGRAEAPEFIEGMLPDMILPPSLMQVREAGAELTPATEQPEPAPVTEPPNEEPPVSEPPVETPEPAERSAEVDAPSEVEPLVAEAAPVPPLPEVPAEGSAEVLAEAPPEPAEASAEMRAPSDVEPLALEAAPVPPVAEEPPVTSPAPEEEPPEPTGEPIPPVEGEISTTGPEPSTEAPELPEAVAAATVAPEPAPAESGGSGRPHWLLSLFTPAPNDAIDWRRGNYTVMARGGRVDSPAGSGELKKQVQMVAEGSVLYAPGGPCGSAADVAPEGFAHPVFRAGFAVTMPLPEVR